MPGPVSLPYTMWGHPSLLLRDIAVNESDQQRVSDSGAIRSGLVPQLKHNAIHRRSPRLEDPPGMYPGFGRGIATACRGGMRHPEPKFGGCDSEHARPAVPGAGWCTQENVTPCAHWSPTRYPLDPALRLVSGHASSVATRLLAPIASARTAIICAPAIYCLELQPRCYSTRSRWWSRPSGRRSPVATRTMASKWAFAGLGGSGYLMPSEMHARLKALLERMAIDLNARLDPVSAIL